MFTIYYDTANRQQRLHLKTNDYENTLDIENFNTKRCIDQEYISFHLDYKNDDIIYRDINNIIDVGVELRLVEGDRYIINRKATCKTRTPFLNREKNYIFIEALLDTSNYLPYTPPSLLYSQPNPATIPKNVAEELVEIVKKEILEPIIPYQINNNIIDLMEI